ncbi:MAG: DNA repair protein RadC [Deltaproteobacteria bacterium]|nr:DNA repair protein RadC [Deltaproteobacteria bacterium]
MEPKYPQTIKDWPEDDRPREKLIKLGPENLSSAELLAIILRTGSKGKSALDHAKTLINTYDGFKGIELASVDELKKTEGIKGIGPAKATQIKAVFEIAKRYSAEKIKTGEGFHSSIQVFNHFHESIRSKKKEVFIAVLLDGKNRMLRDVKISEGSLTSSIVHPREVFNPVIRDSAAAVILVHNHPSGDPAPSREDKEITKRLKEVGELIGVKVLDHIIIGDGRYISFADEGIL